jgi:alkylation response protein AidB-like acyl-CoA dehydrogenase
MTTAPTLEVLENLIETVIEPAAAEVDATGAFPRASIDALFAAGFGGLISSHEVGGAGASFAEAATIVRRLGAACGSTAMVFTMHLSGTAAIEQNGDDATRRAIAAGEHLTTLAFSERGSRSQFWATLSTATADGDHVVLDAEKSWVTSAGEADSYVWTSRPLATEGPSTLWLVPASAPGLAVTALFDGLGLRGNASSPVTATGARIPAGNQLGADGAGLDLALSQVLPWFQLLNASCSLGICDAAVAKTSAHLTGARLEHLDQSLAEQALPRFRFGRMKTVADAASTLVDDACVALGNGRADGALRMLQSKAVAAEAALEVTNEAMRIGGGAAFRKDIGVERHFRDARAASVMAPTSDALHDMIGRALCGLPLL